VAWGGLSDRGAPSRMAGMDTRPTSPATVTTPDIPEDIREAVTHLALDLATWSGEDRGRDFWAVDFQTVEPQDLTMALDWLTPTPDTPQARRIRVSALAFLLGFTGATVDTRNGVPGAVRFLDLSVFVELHRDRSTLPEGLAPTW